MCEPFKLSKHFGKRLFKYEKLIAVQIHSDCNESEGFGDYIQWNINSTLLLTNLTLQHETVIMFEVVNPIGFINSNITIFLIFLFFADFRELIQNV